MYWVAQVHLVVLKEWTIQNAPCWAQECSPPTSIAGPGVTGVSTVCPAYTLLLWLGHDSCVRARLSLNLAVCEACPDC